MHIGVKHKNDWFDPKSYPSVPYVVNLLMDPMEKMDRSRTSGVTSDGSSSRRSCGRRRPPGPSWRRIWRASRTIRRARGRTRSAWRRPSTRRWGRWRAPPAAAT